MITVNAFSRVFFIRPTIDTIGTAFTIEVEGRQYLVTARHVVDDLVAPAQIQISHENQWKTLDVQTLWRHPSADIDVAVIPLALQLSPTLPCEPSDIGLVWGQRVFFLGYPFGMTGEQTKANGGYPLAFVRGAVFSAGVEDSQGKRVLLLDGQCNKGFSGGPIVFRPSENLTLPFAIAGIISEYQTIPEPVRLNRGETQMSVLTNVGLVKGCAIAHAVEGARILGCGCEVASE